MRSTKLETFSEDIKFRVGFKGPPKGKAPSLVHLRLRRKRLPGAVAKATRPAIPSPAGISG